MGDVTDDELQKLYARAKALIFPSEDEDFGMVPVEAMGYGTPVIAHRSGGPRETIVEGKTGLFFDELTVESLVEAIKKFQKMSFLPEKLHEHALGFNKQSFIKGVNRVLHQEVGL